MSSQTVRDAVESRITEAGLGFPLLKSADERAAPASLPALWMTPVYTINTREPQTMGSRPYYEETGSVTIVVFGLTGNQGALARSAAETLRTYFDNFNPSATLTFPSVTGPVEPDPAAEGEYYPVQLIVNYVLNERP